MQHFEEETPLETVACHRCGGTNVVVMGEQRKSLLSLFGVRCWRMGCLDCHHVWVMTSDEAPVEMEVDAEVVS